MDKVKVIIPIAIAVITITFIALYFVWLSTLPYPGKAYKGSPTFYLPNFHQIEIRAGEVVEVPIKVKINKIPKSTKLDIVTNLGKEPAGFKFTLLNDEGIKFKSNQIYALKLRVEVARYIAPGTYHFVINQFGNVRVHPAPNTFSIKVIPPRDDIGS